MGTTHNHDIPAAAALADADQYPTINAGTSRGAYVTGTQLRAFATGGIVNTTATSLAITAALHAGKVITISSAAPIAVTLPQATGTGNKYTFEMRVVATGTSHTIKVANATDVMSGVVYALTTSSDNVIGFKTSASSDTVTLNGTTLGGVVGDIIEVIDVATGFFNVKAFTKPTGVYATPFSAAVP